MCAALEREAGSAYLLSPDFWIRCVNEGWRRFARDNGAPELAAGGFDRGPITQFVALPLRPFLRAGFARVLQRGEPWAHVYECSSPTEYRRFNMRVELAPVQLGLIVVHSCVVALPAPEAVSGFEGQAADYTDARGLIVQCSACGRWRRGREPQRWDWVMGLGGLKVSNLSHGICATCEFQCYGA